MTVKLIILCGALMVVCSGCKSWQMEKWVYDPFKSAQWEKKKKKLESAPAPQGSLTPSRRPAGTPMQPRSGWWPW